MGSAVDFAHRVVRRTATIVRREWRRALLLTAIDATPKIVLEFVDGDMRRLSSLLGLVTLYLQLFATFRMLGWLGVLPADHDPRHPTEGRYPSAFLLSLLSSIPILVGFVALIVPGLLLAGLWGMSLAILAAERRRPIDAMRRSWRLARPRLGAMALLAAIWLGGFVVVVAISAVAALIGDATDKQASAIIDGGASILLILGPMMWATAYAERLAESDRTDGGA